MLKLTFKQQLGPCVKGGSMRTSEAMSKLESIFIYHSSDWQTGLLNCQLAYCSFKFVACAFQPTLIHFLAKLAITFLVQINGKSIFTADFTVHRLYKIPYWMIGVPGTDNFV